ncbi:MAG TPA: DUF4388 domain-containing protein [Thermoanaerobaculia bacterium]|nr:DUF4388 domain-containing protein [Thermoanaerobaculia bacterium]
MRFEGEVGEIELVPRLVELGRDKFTGALRFENDAIIKIIYFKEGDVLSASTNDRTDSIDEIFLKAGKVTREHLKQALSKRKESETLGDALLNLGFITKKELTWARRVQVIGIIRSIQRWTTGSYTLVADYLPKREEGTIFNLAQIILELLLTETDRARLDPTIATGDGVFRRTADFEKFYPELGLNQEADAILTAVDGQRTASEVVEVSSSDAFNVYKLLQALEYLGLIDRGKPKVIDELSGHTEQIEWNEPLPPLPSSEPSSTLVVPLYQPSQVSSFDQDDGLPLNRTLAVPERDYISEAAIVPPEPGAERTRAKAKPMFGQVPKQRRSGRPLIVMLVLLLCGGAAYAAYRYLHRDVAAETAVVEPVPHVRRQPMAVSTVGTSTTSASSTVLTTTAIMPSSSSASTATTSPIGTAAPAHKPVSTAPQTASVAVASQRPSTATALSVAATPPVERAKPAAPARTAAVVPATIAPKRPPAPTPTPKRVIEPRPATSTVSASRPSPPPVTIASSVAPSDLKQKYDAMARANESKMSSAAFTLQFELVCRPESISKALGAGGSSVWFVPITYKGGSCYRVFWGKYATRAEAERASAQIPAILRENKPVVVNLQALRGN